MPPTSALLWNLSVLMDRGEGFLIQTNKLTNQSYGGGFLVSFRVLSRVFSCTSRLKKPLIYKQALDTTRPIVETKNTGCTDTKTSFSDLP